MTKRTKDGEYEKTCKRIKRNLEKELKIEIINFIKTHKNNFVKQDSTISVFPCYLYKEKGYIIALHKEVLFYKRVIGLKDKFIKYKNVKRIWNLVNKTKERM